MDQVHNGLGFFGMLTIAFIVLKLCHVIAWSWFWVLAPLWAPIITLLVITFIGLTGWLIATVISHIRST